jgi:hypothetical protein
MSKGPHKAVAFNNIIVCEYCGHSSPFPSGGCGSNILPDHGKIYLILIIVPHLNFVLYICYCNYEYLVLLNSQVINHLNFVFVCYL